MRNNKTLFINSTLAKIIASMAFCTSVLISLGYTEGPTIDPRVPAPLQFVLLDVTNEWKGTTQYRGNKGELGEQPTKWGTPNDFQNGTIHTRLEIMEKPSDLEVLSMICLWQKGSETCTGLGNSENLIHFTEAGVYYNEYPAPGVGDDVEGSANWNRPKGDHTGDYYFKPTDNCDMVLLQWWTRVEVIENGVAKDRWRVLRHNPKNGVHARIDYGPEVAKHIPIKYRLEIYVVAEGATFDPPGHWNN